MAQIEINARQSSNSVPMSSEDIVRIAGEIKDKYDLRTYILARSNTNKVERLHNGQIKIKSPFRNERTPSFCVSPTLYHDFGDPTRSGDIFRFVKEFDGLDFIDAVKMLGDPEHVARVTSNRVKLPQVTRTPPGPECTHRDILQWHQNLGQVAPFLMERGISEEVSRSMLIGAKSSRWHYQTPSGEKKWFTMRHIVMPYYRGDELVSVKYRRDDLYCRQILRELFPRVKDPLWKVKYDLTAKDDSLDPEDIDDEEAMEAVFGIKYRRKGRSTIYNGGYMVLRDGDKWRFPRRSVVIASPESKELDIMALMSCGFGAIGIPAGTKVDVKRLFCATSTVIVPRDNDRDRLDNRTNEYSNAGLGHAKRLAEEISSGVGRLIYLDTVDVKDLGELAIKGKLAEYMEERYSLCSM